MEATYLACVWGDGKSVSTLGIAKALASDILYRDTAGRVGLTDGGKTAVDQFYASGLDPVTERSGSYQLDQNHELFGEGGPSSADIYQGRGDDCWFLASLGSAADAGLVNDMIRDYGNGMYGVRFFERGPDNQSQEVWITVDADFVRNAEGEEVFARTVDGDGDGKDEFWVALVEKALAAYDGNTLDFHGMPSEYGLYLLTGVSSSTVSEKATDSDIWELVDRVNQGGMAVFNVVESEVEGFVEHHAYTITGCRRDSDTGEIYITIRNPWGRHEPGDDAADDGVFEMSLSALRASTTFSVTASDYPNDIPPPNEEPVTIDFDWG